MLLACWEQLFSAEFGGFTRTFDFDQARVTEDITHSFFAGTGSRHPWEGVTEPIDPADGAKLGLKTGDTVKITSPAGAMVTKLKLWEGVRPGTVTKCYGQGHWAYGRVAAADFAKALPRGGSNNDILVDDYDRLSGSTARNGGFTGVKVQKA